MAKLLPYKGSYYLWHYLPSILLAVIASLLFLLIALLQSWKLYKTKAWFCICFVIGCYFEIIGYIIRIIAHHSTNLLLPFILQSIFILLGPALFAASIYMTLSRLILSLNASHLSPIRPSRLTKAFLLGDFLSFSIQGNSASLTFEKKTQKVGERMIVAGLLVQITSFGLFFVTTVVVHRRIIHAPTAKSLQDPGWKKTMSMLYVVSLLILLRSIFRVVEYMMGNDGYLFVNEWTLYAFDALPMVVVCFFFWKYWPGGIEFEKEEEIGLKERIGRWTRLGSGRGDRG